MRRHTVEQINSCDDGIISVVARNPNQECTGCFKKMTIFPFCNLILLWGLRTSLFMENAKSLKVHLKVMVDIFAFIVRTKDLDFGIELSFNLFVEGFKHSKHFTFSIHHGEPCSTSTIIYKRHKPSKSRSSRDRGRTQNIIMH